MTESVKPSKILRRLKAQFGDKKIQVYAWHRQFLEGWETVKNECHQHQFQLERSLQLYFFILKEFCTLIFSMNEHRTVPHIIANFWTKQILHIVGKDANFQYEILLYDNALYTTGQIR